MANLIWLEGFETDHVSGILTPSYLTFDFGNGSVVAGRNGGSAWSWPDNLGPGRSDIETFALVSPVQTLSIGFYLNYDSDENFLAAAVKAGASGTSPAIAAKSLNASEFFLSVGNVSFSSEGLVAGPFTKGEWLQVEYRTRPTAGATLGRAQLFVNGFLVVDVEQDYASGVLLEGVRFSAFSGVGDTVLLDDIWVTDEVIDGAALPDYAVLGLLPTADGAHQDSTPTTATRADAINSSATDASPDAEETVFASVSDRDSYESSSLLSDYREVQAALFRVRGRYDPTGGPEDLDVMVGDTVVGTVSVPDGPSYSQMDLTASIPAGTSLKVLSSDYGVQIP